MLNWSELNIELWGIAMNGKATLEIKERQLPDIVITDIKMPIMTRLWTVPVIFSISPSVCCRREKS